jgi:hypothetical protein
MAEVKMSHVQIAKVVGENDDGITLFVPKSQEGTFQLTEGDYFYSVVFVQAVAGRARSWIPWRSGE